MIFFFIFSPPLFFFLFPPPPPPFFFFGVAQDPRTRCHLRDVNPIYRTMLDSYTRT
jgi:hypothetical protein